MNSYGFKVDGGAIPKALGFGGMEANGMKLEAGITLIDDGSIQLNIKDR